MGEQAASSSRPSTPRPECRQFDFDDLDALEEAAGGGGADLPGHPQPPAEASAEDLEGVHGQNAQEIPVLGGGHVAGSPSAAESIQTSEWFLSSRMLMTPAMARDLVAFEPQLRAELEMHSERQTPCQREVEGGGVWEVVGGRSEGGVIVRKTRRTCSMEEPSRLAFGARVRELALEGESLLYRKLAGSGPETGWVNTSVAHKGGKAEVQMLRLPPAERAQGAALGSPSALPEGDPVASCLCSGTRHVASFFCDALDMSLFELLRAEIARIQQDTSLPTKNGIWSSVGRRLPAHDFVLRSLTHAFCAEGLSWASNLYEAASVGCGFHHDGSKYGGDSHQPNLRSDITMIASFGATRVLTLRHVNSSREFHFQQRNGDMFAFYKDVDNDFMHGLHPAEEPGEPRISVVIIGRRGKPPADHWAPRFKSNIPLGLPPAGTREPRLIQFSGTFVSEEPHMFRPPELRQLAQRGGSKAVDAFFEMHRERLLLKSGIRDFPSPL